MEEKHEKVILFTSSLPVEGKSTVAANTAMLLSQMNKRVLLIDGDLRIQGLKSTLDVHAESSGLAELLKDGAKKPQFLAVDDSDLVLLAGDTPVRNPVSLLKQDRLHEVLEQLRQQFDYIVIDTPPCIMMADAASLCRYADRVVYVVRQDYASRGQITDGIQIMSDAGAKLAGFVFNRAGASVAGGYGYHYSYGRGYGYGKGYKYTEKKH
jgi:receptor protein-tyrosine kinase